MNLLLFETILPEVGQRVTVRDRQAQHLIGVLRVEPGRSVLAGNIQRDGLLKTSVVEVGQDSVTLDICERIPALSPPRKDALLLAMPRPRVLRRMLIDAASLGFEEIHVTRSWRVEKSHLQARVLAPAAVHEALVLGLEQGVRTHLPRCTIHTEFRDGLAACTDLPPQRFVAHPSTTPVATASPAPCTLAIGPDGGWIDRELESLEELGFRPLSLGPHPLRTEAALSALMGALTVARGSST